VQGPRRARPVGTPVAEGAAAEVAVVTDTALAPQHSCGRISLHLKTKAGIALVLCGAAIWYGWNRWAATRNLEPVNVPAPLLPGQTVSSFHLNFDGLYLIEIEAEPSMPADRLHCLLGVGANTAQCGGVSSVLAANWTLLSNGKELKRGGTTELHSAPQSKKVARVIGDFDGKSGTTYDLRVNFLGDATILAPANPRLKVTVADLAHTDLDSAGVLLFSLVFICELFGVILLGIAYYAKHHPTSA